MNKWAVARRYAGRHLFYAGPRGFVWQAHEKYFNPTRKIAETLKREVQKIFPNLPIVVVKISPERKK